MQYQDDGSYSGFQLIEQKEIKEIQGIGKWLVHKATGVTVLALQNTDPHKVFSISFATRPDNNKGAAHIVEHAVCCASKKYPLKETFMAVSQGSICTNMNACTYPDRTMYYVSSAHEKDLLGIAEVFLDMVFHPCLEESSQYFLQEGWHYTYDEETSELDFSGVVYHEMLGEYGEAGSYLQLYEMETLFPNSFYKYDSGGIPEEIVTLTEEEFLHFYKEHYVGENATITLYGDFNLKDALQMLDQKGLQDVPVGKKQALLKDEPAFEKPRYTIGYYPSNLSNAPTLLSLSFVVGKSTDCELRLAFEILEQMLIQSTASPLLKGLIMEEQLGMSLSDGGFDSCRNQPVFSITIKGSSKEKATQFEERALAILEDVVHNGLESSLIDAAIESLEFELRETDASYEPIGIIYSEMMLSSILYEGNPFNHIAYQKALDHIKANCHKGYFEQLIKHYLLENPHRSLTVVTPSKKAQTDKEMKRQQALEAAKEELGKKGLMQVVQMNHWLDEQQLRENDEELLKTLPQLSLADMPKQLEKLKVETLSVLERPVLYHQEETKEIIYFHFLWDIKGISSCKRQDIGLLAHIFSYTGTKNKTYSEVENAINTVAGGFHAAVHAYTAYKDDTLLPVFKVSCKLLERHIDGFMNLLEELLTLTQFSEKEKLKELIGHIVYEMERSFTGAAEYRATQRTYTYLCEQGVYEDDISGFAFYHYVKALYADYDNQYDALVERLMGLMQEIFKAKRLSISVTAPEHLKPEIIQALSKLIQHLSSENPCFGQDEKLKCYAGNEGFYNGQDGQAIAKGIDFKTQGMAYRGQYEVVANVLENTYLWDRVRLQGGAYGCDILLSKEGYLVVCSYCDPHLKRTLKTYSQISDYLKHIQLEDKVIERTIISTLGAMIAPCSMEQKSERACTYFITGMKQEERQKVYDEIKRTTLKDFHDMAKLFELMATKGRVCVLGNKEKLQGQKMEFKLIDLEI